jgi:hypothetical protein
MIRALAAAALFALLSPASAETVTFGEAPPGALPASFASALTGQGRPGRWEVVEDATAGGGRALAQLDEDRTDYRFPLAVYQPAAPADLEVTIRFKPVSGKVDQAGGVIVRLVDPNNYCVARANALEDNVRFYRVVAGRREQLAGANAGVAGNAWHTLTLRAEGDRFTVSYDGKRLFAATDKTFAQAGRIALWTKADSVTRFDRIEIEPLRPGK